MDRSELILKRQRKLMGQLLRNFDTNLLPRLPEDVSTRFKAAARQKFKALAEESIEIMELDPETELNGHGIAVKDTLSSTARAAAPLGGGSQE